MVQDKADKEAKPAIRKGYRMDFEYHIADGQAAIIRCYGQENRVEIPEALEGFPVTRLEAYAFSAAKRTPDREKAICGEELYEIKLPRTLREIGNYAFYGCRNLNSLTMYHRTRDIAGGAFTGCHKLCSLTVYMEQAWGYCLKDLISELRHEIRVTLIYEENERAELIFPEYYEEAVENTPARMLETRFHGSGYSYRQCFRDGVFFYPEYDRLFFEAQVWESEDFCIELCMLRLLHPYRLSEDAKGCYISWMMEHRMSAALWCITFEQEERLEFISSFIEWRREELDSLIREANEKGVLQIQSFLMDYKHRHCKTIKKTFEL